MREATKLQEKKLLDFLEQHVEDCIYLHLDIFHYGLDSDSPIKVWYEEKDDTYSLVVMQFHDGLQVYSPQNDFDPDLIRQIAKEHDIRRIFARKDTIDYICNDFPDFIAEYGSVIELTSHRNYEKYYDDIRQVTLEDIPKVVELLLMDESNAEGYTQEDFEEMLRGLILTDMGMSYVMEKDGEMVATVTISAKTDKTMVGAYTMVHPDYRNTLYGQIVDSYLINRVKGNHRLFGFVMDPQRVRMFQLLKNSVVSYYGKLIKIS